MAEAGTGVCARILKLKSDRGQALVELAFVLPLILLLLFGIIDFGLAYNTENSDTNLANLAARSVSVMTTTTMSCGATSESNLQSWVLCTAAAEGVNTGPSASPTLSACVTTTSYAAGSPITVEVNRKFSWTGIVGGLGGLLSGLDSTIGSSATNRIEQTPTTTGNSFLTPAC